MLPLVGDLVGEVVAVGEGELFVVVPVVGHEGGLADHEAQAHHQIEPEKDLLVLGVVDVGLLVVPGRGLRLLVGDRAGRTGGLFGAVGLSFNHLINI